MSRYNPFPVVGQLNDGDKVYMGVHTISSSTPVANSFRYVTYQTNNQEIFGHDPVGFDSDTGAPIFGENIELIIWTYKKCGSSTAYFSTDITGTTQYLYTEKSGLLFPPSSLSSTRICYQTQGLPDLWAGYFGYLIRKDNQNSTVKINMGNPSNFVTVIPTTIYDKDNSCAAINNDTGQGLASAIVDYKANTNTKIYWSSLASCQSSIPVTYCQNQDIIFSSNKFDQNSNTDAVFCGQSLGTESDGGGSDISNSCMAICSNFGIDRNNPVCYPGTVNNNIFGCNNYNANRSIYNGNNDDGGGGDDVSKNGKPIYKQTWFIFMLIAIGILVFLIVILIVFKGRKDI